MHFGTGRQPRALDSTWAKNVKDSFATRDQIIRDNASMAPPPNRLCAHDSANRYLPHRAKFRERSSELLAQRVVSVVVKALVLPESIHMCRYIRAPLAETAEIREVLVLYACPNKLSAKRSRVELRLRARPGDCSYVGNQ
jgi:hypothetical protein